MTRRLAHTRTEQLDQIVRAKRRVHPELRRRLDWSGFRAICEREGVLVTLTDIERGGCLFCVAGQWVIALQRDGVRHLHPGCHELGHLWAHVDQEALGRAEATFYMDVEWAEDPREEEADYIASVLQLGPTSRARG